MSAAYEPRCLSSCEVVPGVLKRCVRAVGHAEDHLWVEALNRCNGYPMLASWAEVDAGRPVVADIIVRSSP